MSKQTDVEDALIDGEWLTQEQVRKRFKAWRLASIIFRTRAKRYNGERVVIREVPTGPTGYGTYYAPRRSRYLLKMIRSATDNKKRGKK